MATIQRIRSNFVIEVGGRNNLSAAVALSSRQLVGEAFLSGKLTVDSRIQTHFRVVGSGFVRNGTGQSHKISALAQQAVTDALVTLYELDLEIYDLGVARFVSAVTEKDSVRWGGNVYAPYPVECTGFEWSGTGSPPRPSLKMATILPLLTALIIGGNDLIGCKLTRIRTFRRFLDDGDEPSTADTFQLDEFRVERKVAHNKMFAEFELASVLDQQGATIPRRQAIKNYCSFIYRRWDAVAGEFVYDKYYPCPYAGSVYYDIQGRQTTADKDRCSKTLTACRRRFGTYNPIPFSGFPGMAMVRG